VPRTSKGMASQHEGGDRLGHEIIDAGLRARGDGLGRETRLDRFSRETRRDDPGSETGLQTRQMVASRAPNGDLADHPGHENYNASDPNQVHDQDENCGSRASAFCCQRPRNDQAGPSNNREESKTNRFLRWLADVCDSVTAAVDRLKGKSRKN
jgi:hypothetical protein